MKPTGPTPTATTPVGSGQRGPPRPRAGNPQWYADKVIDELRVKTCADGDGFGGPHGLTELVVNHSADVHPWCTCRCWRAASPNCTWLWRVRASVPPSSPSRCRPWISRHGRRPSDDLQRALPALPALPALQALQALRAQRMPCPAPLAELAARVAGAAPQLTQRIASLRAMAPVGLKTRLHGDLHLGQTLVSQDDFVLIDFECEPSRPFQERRAKHPALRDMAAMLRSFEEAHHSALQQAAPGATDHQRLSSAVRQWAQQMRAGFLRRCADFAAAVRLHADTAAFDAAQSLIALFEIGRALQELHTAFERRPDTLAVALAGLASLVDVGDRNAAAN